MKLFAIASNNPNHKSAICGLVGVTALLFTLVVPHSHADIQKLYRYLDENGTEVTSHFVPPKYVQNGYEVLNKNGILIRTVPPAPTEEVISKREIAREFDTLYRRFRSIEEIDRAKLRVIASIESSIAILEGNVKSLESELNSQVEKAAMIERRGHTVSDSILEAIQATKIELNVTNELLDKRNKDKANAIKVHEDYKSLFIKGQIIKKELKNY